MSLRRAPLWLLAASGTAAGPLLLTVLVSADEAHRGARLGGLLALGLGCSALTALVTALIFARVTHVLRLLERASSPAGPSPAHGWPRLVTREVAGVVTAIEALRSRVRIADEVADRQRRIAQDASAGVFRLVAGLVAAEEGARGQLSAELHDTVAQSLLSARMLLADGDPDRAHAAVDEAEEQVRALMARTRPPQLRDGDLAQATAALRDELHRRYGLLVHLSWPEVARPLPLAVAVVVYRFFQEALLNVIKHADVDHADVRLDFPVEGPGGLTAVVTDRGAGFIQSDTTSAGGRHVGLALMAERARLAGGAVEVTSTPGMGTSVRLTLPSSALGSPPTELTGGTAGLAAVPAPRSAA